MWLLAGAHTAAARVAVAIYWASLAGLFGTSASYHLFAHSERAVTWLRRADHSMIFVLIAGSYTPFCLLVLPRVWGIPMLVVMWVTALAGIIMKMIRVTADGGRSGSWLYVVAGWSAVVALPKLLSELGAARMALLIIGGIVSTKAAQNVYRVGREASSNLNSLVNDNVSGVRQIKAYHLLEQELARFNVANEGMRKANLKINFFWAVSSPYRSVSTLRTNAWASWACWGEAVRPVPMAQTGS